jgi:hypothetical protein
MAAEPALFEVRAVCTATVVETWTLRVPGDMAARLLADPGEALDVLDRLGELRVEFVGCVDEVSEERERTIESVSAFDPDGNRLQPLAELPRLVLPGGPL